MTIPLSPTEQRLFDLLADGLPHPRKDMIKAVDPGELVEWRTVHVHVTNIRTKIKAGGLDILARDMGMHTRYQLVRLYLPEEVGG